MKTYRICVYEVNEAGEVGPLVDIVECQAEPIPSGQNVFHLVRELERRISAESEAAS